MMDRQPGDDADRVFDAVVIDMVQRSGYVPPIRERFDRWIRLQTDCHHYRAVLTTWTNDGQMYGRLTVRGEDWMAKIAIAQDKVYWVERPDDIHIIAIMLAYC